jgi:CRP-like cAMP-binding protein
MNVEKLIALLNSFAELEKSLEAHLRPLIKTTCHKKGDLLVRPDDIARRISFIEEGIIRGYRLTGNIELTSYFMTKGDIFISVQSFLTQTPAKEYIECMEDCILHSISFEELRRAYQKYPSFQEHRAELLQQYYLLSIEREEMRRLLTYDRYCYLMENQPYLITRIKDKYLASYLNMAKSTFSRNKKKYMENSKRRR